MGIDSEVLPDPARENCHSVEIALDQLATGDAKELRRRWEKQFGNEPPPRLSKEFMMLALAWEVQASAYGGFSRETKAALRKLKTGLRAQQKDNPAINRRRPAPGTTLVREWHGQVHQVLILEEGFAYDGKVWKSLSEIARSITGARWNGPRFFGLRSNRVSPQ